MTYRLISYGLDNQAHDIVESEDYYELANIAIERCGEDVQFFDWANGDGKIVCGVFDYCVIYPIE